MPDHFHALSVGEAALVRGDLASAEVAFARILAATPAHDGALTDLALVRVQQGRPGEAATLFRQALDADPSSEAAFFGLLDTLYDAEGPEAARAAFHAHEQSIPQSEEKQRYWDGLDVAPEPGRLRILFVCGPDDKFITALEHGAGRRHEVRTLHFQQNVDLAAIQRGMDWADVTWFEWCDAILVNASRKLRKTSRVVCRLHRYEAFGAYPAQVDWSFVDRLVLVASPMKEVLRRRFPGLEHCVAMQVIDNGVDLSAFKFTRREPGFDLAYIGYLHYRKNPSLLLQCVRALVDHDSRYRLHVAGVHQQPECEVYVEYMIDRLNLSEHVVMHGWVEDVSAWLEDKQYLVSSSIHEGCPYNVIEAAARGLKPLVHDFFGASELFPRDWLFGTVAEFVKRATGPAYDSERYRAVVERRYAQERQVAEVERLLECEVNEGRARRERAGGDGVAAPASGRAEVTVQPSDRQDEAAWVPVDPALAPFLAGEQFHNGLRIPFGKADAEVPVRLAFLERLVAGKAIIDLGCTDHAPLIEQKAQGGRWLHSRLAAAAATCLGIDIDADGIAAARKLGYEVLRVDVVQDPVPDEVRARRWDYFIVGEVLEHIGNPVAFLTAIREKYAPYVERLVVTVPNGFRAENYAFGQQGLEVINSDHRFWFSPYTLLKVMSDAGLAVEGYRLVQSMPAADPKTHKLLTRRPLFRDGIAAVGRL